MQASRNDINRIIASITFRFSNPQDSTRTAPYERVVTMGRSLPVHMINTNIDDNIDELIPLLSIDSMSTIANAYIIYSLTKYLDQNECYLNIGVWKGFSFLAGVVNKSATSIGVDNFSEFGGPEGEFYDSYKPLAHHNSKFFNMDYIEYFKASHEGPIGMYFYDGEHSYENQLKALEVAEPYLSRNAIIIVDDTNFKQARDATLDFLKNRHPAYEIVLDQFTAENCHPTFHNGLMILRKVS